MKLYKVKVGLFIPLFLSLNLPIQCMQSQENPSSIWYFDKNNLAMVAAAATATFLGYKLIQYSYNEYKNYLDSKIENEIVDAIVLALTPNSALEELPENERANALRKKAWLINMRKRILTQLTDIISDTSNALTQAHRDSIATTIKKIKSVFLLIDIVRSKNPYEKEYKEPSMLDSIIERNIINSIILTLKPDSECTQEELNEKKVKELRKAKIIKKLKTKASGIILSQLAQLSFFTY